MSDNTRKKVDIKTGFYNLTRDATPHISHRAVGVLRVDKHQLHILLIDPDKGLVEISVINNCDEISFSKVPFNDRKLIDGVMFQRIDDDPQLAKIEMEVAVLAGIVLLSRATEVDFATELRNIMLDWLTKEIDIHQAMARVPEIPHLTNVVFPSSLLN